MCVAVLDRAWWRGDNDRGRLGARAIARQCIWPTRCARACVCVEQALLRGSVFVCLCVCKVYAVFHVANHARGPPLLRASLLLSVSPRPQMYLARNVCTYRSPLVMAGRRPQLENPRYEITISLMSTSCPMTVRTFAHTKTLGRCAHIHPDMATHRIPPSAHAPHPRARREVRAYLPPSSRPSLASACHRNRKPIPIKSFNICDGLFHLHFDILRVCFSI